MAVTLAKLEKFKVSSESAAVPDGHPFTDARFIINKSGETLTGSGSADKTTRVPLNPRAGASSETAFELVAVARIILAPPSFVISSTALLLDESI